MSARALPLLFPALLAAPAVGRVVEVSERGFVIEAEAVVAVPPARLWALLVEPARWWSPRHSWSGDARNLRIEPRAGGCFCETLPGGGSVEHLRVVYVDPGKLLRMTGGLGPFQGDPAAGPMTWTLAADPKGTRLSVRYALAGMMRTPFATIAPIADAVIVEQVARLKAAAEAGGG